MAGPGALTLPRQFGRFAAVGVAGTLTQYALLGAGVEWLGARAAVASGVGYAVGTGVAYGLNRAFTFAGSRSHAGAAPRYFAVQGIGWCCNTALMGLLAHQLGWHYWLAQGLATAVVLLWNFSGSKWWAFGAAR